VTPDIRTPDHRLRVFVSSTLGELATERSAAREAIEQIRLTPIMFELGARPHPPRALYRAYLDQSDVFVGIYWQRYGWVAPDMSISGLEDEFRLSAGMKRLMYVKEPAPDREEGLQRLLSDLEREDTTSYKPFRDADELRRLLADDLAIMLTESFVGDRQDEAHAPSAPAPRPTTSLIGRSEDIAAVTRLLVEEGRRLVTLTGGGGMGKTRLAVAVVDATAGRWRDGTIFVDLSSVRDPAAVLDVIAGACGALPQGAESTTDALVRRLCDRETLIVLDNFEQVVPAAPDVVEILERCPGVRLLVTSRVLLRVRGEREHPVAPLSLAHPDATAAEAERAAAVELFVERACDVRPSFELTEENVAAITELCRRLDGVPLALELAAARSRLLSPRQLLEHLGGRLDASEGFADLPERQRTLRATLDWSYQLLDLPTQLLFARLSVFSGAFTLEGAEAVCSWGDEDFETRVDVQQELSTLIDHSLVSFAARPDGEPAFRLLETVRGYAAGKLDEAGESNAVFERLHQHMIALLEKISPKLSSPAQAAAFQTLDAEVDNIFTSMGWAIAAGRSINDLLYAIQVSTWLYWIVRGQYRRFPPDLPAIVRGSPLAAAMTDQGWADVYFAQAGQLFASARFDEIVAVLPDQIAVVEEAGRTTQVALMLLCLAASRPFEPGGPARREFEHALELVADADQINAGYILVHMGSLLLAEGDTSGARSVQEKSLTIADAVGDPNLTAESHFQLAHDSVHAGDLDEARAHATAAAEHYRRADHLEGKAYTLGCLAGIAVAEDDAALAARLLGAASALRESIDIRPWPLVGEVERGYAARARNALSADAFEEAFGLGRQMDANEAIELCLRRAVSTQSSLGAEWASDSGRSRNRTS
jgi:predicted ATPase/tetratricopeptide (TPR) repeat protein